MNKSKIGNQKTRDRLGTKIATGLLILAMFAGIAMPVEAYTYNRQAAVDYARSNWNSWVPGSSYFSTIGGGDCTNFISWSLNAGGWIQTKPPSLTWYYDNWLYRQYSLSWTTVSGFRDFVILSGRGTEEIFPAGTYYLPGTSPIKIGDIIQMDGAGGYAPDGKWDHTMIITRVYTVQGFKLFDVTYHSDNTLDRPLQDIFNNNKDARFRVLFLKDTYSS